ASRKSEKDFNWGKVAPDQIDPAQKDRLARQVRIMLAAGKGAREIGSWLRQNGLSPPPADAFVPAVTEAPKSNWWERFCGRASLVLIGVLSVDVLVLVVKQRPWDGTRWTWLRGSMEIPAIVGFALFCCLYMGAMTALWYLAMRFGGFLDRLRD